MRTCFWKHDWEKWKTIQDGNVLDGRKEIIGIAIMQERICIRCNLKELKATQALI